MDRPRERRPPGRRGGRRGRGGGGRAARAVLAALALGASAGPAALAADPGRDDVAGTYRLKAAARVDAAAPLGRSLEARGDAVARPAGRGTVRFKLASMGHACELTAARAEDGTLAFGAGQRCALDLREGDGARGHVEARLRSGRGRLRDRHLSLDLAFDLSGAAALPTSPGADLLGVRLPASWTPDFPVSGGASVRAEGDRDESRAAEPR